MVLPREKDAFFPVCQYRVCWDHEAKVTDIALFFNRTDGIPGSSVKEGVSLLVRVETRKSNGYSEQACPEQSRREGVVSFLPGNSKNTTPWLFLHSLDLSFLHYILEENLHVSRSLFKKASDEKTSSYYSAVSMFRMLLLRHLRNLPSDAKIPRFLEKNDKYAKVCGLSPLANTSRILDEPL